MVARAIATGDEFARRIRTYAAEAELSVTKTAPS
jgi:hypothetical protein